MLRQNGFRGRIILITHEGTLPYDRVGIFVFCRFKGAVQFYLSGPIIETTHEKTAGFIPSRSIVFRESENRVLDEYGSDEYQLE